MLEGDKKRASWLYKSILKKSKSRGKTEEFDESYHTRHSDSSSISSNHSNEHIPTNIIPNENISRVHTINIASTSSIPHKHDIKNRRHSFDSFHSFTRAEHPPHIHNDNDSVEIQHPHDKRIDKEVYIKKSTPFLNSFMLKSIKMLVFFYFCVENDNT